MAIEAAVRKTVGRVIFDLERGEERTTRTIDIAYAKTDTTSADIQSSVNLFNTTFTSLSNGLNVFVQPASWRDTNDTEEQWTTTKVSYEIVETITQQITPGNNRADNQLEDNHEENKQEEWNNNG